MSSPTAPSNVAAESGPQAPFALSPWLAHALNDSRRLPAVLGVIHAAVDAACAMAVLSTVVFHRLNTGHAFYLVVAYNILAFAGQAPAGALTDRLRRPRGATLLGLALTALATMTLTLEPVTTMVLAGVGNAFFHVGAGAMVLRLNPDRATAPGIYVAPGALGLALGVWLGRGGWTLAWPFALALAVGFAVTWFIAVPPATYAPTVEEKRTPRPQLSYPKLVIGLLLVSVTVRSLLGFAGAYAVPKEAVVMFGLATAAFGGKALGGIVSDRIGWLETSVGALLLSAPLIAFGGSNALLVIIGMFLFQMTMPVTLSAIALVIPGRPGLAFGMPCLALILGALPTFYSSVKVFYGPFAFLGLVVLSAASVLAGLHLLGPRNPVKGILSKALERQSV